MKKIPTLFQRTEDRRRVVDAITPGCEWVAAGEGVATTKLDGSCCMVRGGNLYKRYQGFKPPIGFEVDGDVDPATGKLSGWVPIGMGPEDKHHREALENFPPLKDGTYELVGPKVNGNPEKYPTHALVPHGHEKIANAPRTFDELRAWLEARDIEGIVWHHPDGRMAKIKKRDFGLNR